MKVKLAGSFEACLVRMKRASFRSARLRGNGVEPTNDAFDVRLEPWMKLHLVRLLGDAFHFHVAFLLDARVGAFFLTLPRSLSYYDDSRFARVSPSLQLSLRFRAEAQYACN